MQRTENARRQQIDKIKAKHAAGEIDSMEMERKLASVESQTKMQRQELAKDFSNWVKPAYDATLSFRPGLRKSSPTPEKISRLNKKNAEMQSYLQPLLAGVEKIGKSVNLANVPTYYLKDDLLGELRLQLSSEKDPEACEVLLSTIKDLQDLPGTHCNEGSTTHWP